MQHLLYKLPLRLSAAQYFVTANHVLPLGSAAPILGQSCSTSSHALPHIFTDLCRVPRLLCTLAQSCSDVQCMFCHITAQGCVPYHNTGLLCHITTQGCVPYHNTGLFCHITTQGCVPYHNTGLFCHITTQGCVHSSTGRLCAFKYRKAQVQKGPIACTCM